MKNKPNRAKIAYWEAKLEEIANQYFIPVFCITKNNEKNIEIIAINEGCKNQFLKKNTPYLKNSNTYCEWVINNNDSLIVPNAGGLELWNKNPLIEKELVSYIGYPIYKQDGAIFGTICAMDTKTNNFSDIFNTTIKIMKSLVEEHLIVIEKEKNIHKKLQSLIPVCANCHTVKESEKNWILLEKYIEKHSDTTISQTLCPTCAKSLVKKLQQDIQKYNHR